MSKKLFVMLSVLLIAVFVLSACATPTAAPTAEPVMTEAPVVTEAPTAAPTEAPAAEPVKVCMVTDSGGLGDKSFNDITWKGLKEVLLISVLKATTFNPLNPLISAPT